MTEPQHDWHSEFADGDLGVLRSAIPQAVQASQVRASRAQAEYADPDGDQDVYGAGMARGVQKELASRLTSLDSYREELVAGSRRKLTFVGEALVFPHRVGKQMPRNHLRVRLNYLPESRRDLLTRTSNHKYAEPALFDIEAEQDSETATLADAVAALTEANRTETLFVPYYSSTAAGVGSIYWAPARLNGRYLEFTSPERLVFERVPAVVDIPATGTQPTRPGFASTERPATNVRLRRRPPSGTENN
jgi:hypothetical protein